MVKSLFWQIFIVWELLFDPQTWWLFLVSRNSLLPTRDSSWPTRDSSWPKRDSSLPTRVSSKSRRDSSRPRRDWPRRPFNTLGGLIPRRPGYLATCFCEKSEIECPSWNLNIGPIDPKVCRNVGAICIHLPAISHGNPNMFRRVMAEHVFCIRVSGQPLTGPCSRLLRRNSPPPSRSKELKNN